MNIHVENAVISVDAETVHRWMDANEVVLVDVRETSEFDQEHIPGALLLPMSVFDSELFPTVPGKKIVLHCAIGKRSEAAGKMLLKEGHSNVIHMSGGLIAWKDAGFETEEQFTPPTVSEMHPETGQAAEPNDAVSASPGTVLVDEFMKPLDLQETELAIAIGVGIDTINGVIEGETAITAELSLRLARYFCTDNDFWLNLQLKKDLEEASQSIGHSLVAEIKPRLCA